LRALRCVLRSAPQGRAENPWAGDGGSGVNMRYGIGAAVLLCALLAGCGGKPSPSADRVPAGGTDQPPMAQSDTDEFHHDDPCSLLDPKEVEAVFGGPLGTAPYRGSNDNPTADGSDCVYRSANFQSIILSVNFDGGQQAYHVSDFVGNLVKGTGAVNDKTKKAMVSEDGSEIAGEWDEAKLTPFTCCVFNALRADQMISIDFTGSSATLKQAAGLVDAALKRMDKPLSLDGGANVAAAKAFLSTRPARRDPCSVLSQAEAEAILGKLIAPPVAQADSCSYELPPQGIRQIYELRYRWRGGNYDFRTDLQAAKMAGTALGTMELKTTTQERVPDAPAATGADSSGAATAAPGSPGFHTVTTTTTVSVDEAARQMTGQTFTQGTHLTGEQGAAGGGPWERSAVIGPKFKAVKKDLAVEIDLRGVDPAKAKSLAAAAMQKL